MYFTYGWPTVLQLKPRRVKKHSGFTIEDMIYDDEASTKSTTTNKNENAERNAKASVKEQPERVVQMLPSPIDGRYIAILTTKRLSIWSGHQVKQTHFIIATTHTTIFYTYRSPG